MIQMQKCILPLGECTHPFKCNHAHLVNNRPNHPYIEYIKYCKYRCKKRTNCSCSLYFARISSCLCCKSKNQAKNTCQNINYRIYSNSKKNRKPTVTVIEQAEDCQNKTGYRQTTAPPPFCLLSVACIICLSYICVSKPQNGQKLLFKSIISPQRGHFL